MSITDPFVLPSGAVLISVSNLPETLRKEMQAQDGDFALSRRNSRTQSKVLNADAADLIRQFEQPRTIAQAVARFSRDRKEAAEAILENALPMLQSLIAERLLVHPNSQDREQIAPSLQDEAALHGWRILRCVQTLEDVELYQVCGADGTVAALKIARQAGSADSAQRILAREAQILRHLKGRLAPRLIDTGTWNNRSYLLMEWCSGVDANTACEEYRQRNTPESRCALLRITRAILHAYAELHQQGIIHGDVHMRNVLVDRYDSVKLIDFGLAAELDSNHDDLPPSRGGVGFFFEPEFARAVLANQWPPAVTTASEQYAVAALVYFLVTGLHYAEFSLQKNEMLRQIAEESMLSFANRGLESWAPVEAALAKALSKDPLDRFASMFDLASCWPAHEAAAVLSVPTVVVRNELQHLRSKVLARVGFDGPLLNAAALPAPTTSVNYGAAGIAYALYRMSSVEGDPEMLALADLWSRKAIRQIEDSTAFYNPELQITSETVGRSALFHSPAGVFAVNALIARARGDMVEQHSSVAAFINVSANHGDKFDITLGSAGTLLACSFLLDRDRASCLLDGAPESMAALKSFGSETANFLWKMIEPYPAIMDCQELSNLGAAHGWAGLLYALLCWSCASGEPLPAKMIDRLDQLGQCAEPVQRGLRWKWDLARSQDDAGGGWMPGWCNGSAGYVFLWTLAHSMLRSPRYLDLAYGAAWNAWEAGGGIGNLCCGLAGQAYSLLNMYRHSDDPVWLQRAADLTKRAAEALQNASDHDAYKELALRPESLYKGELGVVLLAAELDHPAEARMPLFELGL